ncbi:glycosyltransferase [Psychroserpens sp. Hel_I_66]|uniref:glycosyltransferase n=1 Tax=Psychroserpens sp. Hel_I_66 TaxID=1250004 RepID=UPI000645F66B|nr:glycosyltransferase [Psychroserpens sp. Hel_I_66]
MSNPKKKIAFVIASLASGGAERVISNLSNTLIENYEIIIITFSESKPFYNLDQRIKVISCLDKIEQPKSIFQSLKLNYLLTKRIFQILKKEHVNVSIGFITSANILSTIASKFYGIPCIISERNNPLVEEVPKFWVLLRSLVYPLADKMVLQTEGVKKIYENKIRKNKISILPNPIASELTNLRDHTIKKENLILTVGRLDENKCHEDIIQAFKTIKVHNWKLLIIGDGDKKEKLIKLIKSSHQSDKIKIISKVKDIENYYNKASIFVFTSKTEGFPNALLEAMHFGLPSISTNCDFGPSDLINDGTNGFLIPLNDSIVLRERLSQLIDSKKLRHIFSQRSIQRTENYESKKAVAQWEQLINSLLLLKEKY